MLGRLEPVSQGWKSVRAHEVSFLDLVQGEKQFQVPLYQRTYSWGGKQLAQLWRDLLAQGREMADGAPAGTHFMGSVVITPSPTLQAAGVNRWLLVDGQQRLTTLMLALAAIRDHGGSDADRIHRQYLVNEFRQGDDHLRLLPTQADRDVYRAIVLDIPGTPQPVPWRRPTSSSAPYSPAWTIQMMTRTSLASSRRSERDCPSSRSPPSAATMFTGSSSL